MGKAFFRDGFIPQDQAAAYRQYALEENCVPLGVVGISAALLEGLALYAARSAPLLCAFAGQAAGIICVTGLCFFGLYFLTRKKGKTPSGVMTACQGAFAAWMLLANVFVCYQGVSMPGGWLLAAPMLLFSAVMILPDWGAALLNGLYLLCLALLFRWHALLAYVLCLGAACYAASRLRAASAQKAYLSLLEAEDSREAASEMKQRLKKNSTLDKELPVHNLRAMSAWLEAVWPLCVRNQIPVLVVMVSPRDAGGDMLRLAGLMKPLIRRQSDFLGLYERDVFVFLYSGPSRQDSAMLMDRIKAAVPEELPIVMGGLYAMPKPRMVAAQLLTQARETLGTAKEQGLSFILSDYAE